RVAGKPGRARGGCTRDCCCGGRISRHGRTAFDADASWKWNQYVAERSGPRGLTRGGKGIDSESIDAYSLEPAPRSPGAADQLQGFAVQIETNWLRGIRSQVISEKR